MPLIKAVLFDADGVVIRPHRFSAYLAQEHGLTGEHTRRFFQGDFLNCLVGAADLRTVIVPYLEQWRWQDTVEEFLDVWFAQENAPDARMLAAVADLRARGMPCYLATNQEHHRIAYLRTQMAFDRLFDGVFASAEIGAMKPDAVFYDRVTALLGLAPEQILFWDDSAGNVTGARTYGWRAEHFTDAAGFLVGMERYLAES